jgi:hypothetical protein
MHSATATIDKCYRYLQRLHEPQDHESTISERLFWLNDSAAFRLCKLTELRQKGSYVHSPDAEVFQLLRDINQCYTSALRQANTGAHISLDLILKNYQIKPSCKVFLRRRHEGLIPPHRARDTLKIDPQMCIPLRRKFKQPQRHIFDQSV